MNFKVGIGKRIKALRKARGLTQQGLADRSGLSKSFISQVEAGKAGVTAESLEKMGQALEIPGHFMMDHDLWKREHPNQIAGKGALIVLARAKKIEPEYYDYILDTLETPSARPKGVEELLDTYKTLKDWESRGRKRKR